MHRAQKLIEKLFAAADVRIGGARPWDIKVHDERFYPRVVSHGNLGLGEAYMSGWWDCDALDQFFYKILSADLEKKVSLDWTTVRTYLQSRFWNIQNEKGSKKVAVNHYDLSAKLYMSFLDPYNQYTCGYFKDTSDLNEAQEKKMDLICKKLRLRKGDKVLDIGCGWGGFAKFAAERYGCEVTGITISKEQAVFAREFTKGLPVTILDLDYRKIKGYYDKIVICGMIEHVGYKNYRRIFKIVEKNLADDGLFLLHTIGSDTSVTRTDSWIDKYIFPNGMLPSIAQIGKTIEKLFTMEDWHNFSAYYDPTLMAWFKNFEKNWDDIKADYDERFRRMWEYYLLSCAGSFRARKNQLWQIVLSKHGVPGGYEGAR